MATYGETLGETETALGETEAALGETETALGETEAALGETETALGEMRSKGDGLAEVLIDGLGDGLVDISN